MSGFLQSLKETAEDGHLRVTLSAQLAGVSQSYVYRFRNRSGAASMAFRRAWDELALRVREAEIQRLRRARGPVR